MSKKKSKPTYNPQVSLFNWFVTLLISIIPGVNILFFIFCISFARTPDKRRFGTAALILTLLLVVAVWVIVVLMSDQIVDWAHKIVPEATPAP